MNPPDRWEPGDRLRQALDFATRTHSTQRRKGADTPYMAHLLSVCALVIEDGGSEDEAIAALLHDAAEDQGGEAMLDEIESRFGPEARRIVAACSDTFEMPKPPWRARKEAYIAAVAHKRDDELRVSLADKLHNARAILFDHRQIGERLWARFSANREEVVWYYRSLADAFTVSRPGPMADELDRVVAELERRVAEMSGVSESSTGSEP